LDIGTTVEAGWQEGAFLISVGCRSFAYFFSSTIRLPGDNSHSYGQGSGALATLASVPWFLIGVLGIAWEHTSSFLGSATAGYRSRRGYRDVPVDEDAQVLHFEDEE